MHALRGAASPHRGLGGRRPVHKITCDVHDVKFNPLRAVRRARFGDSVSTTLAPLLSRLLLLGVTFGGLEMQLSGPKTDFGAQGAP